MAKPMLKHARTAAQKAATRKWQLSGAAKRKAAARAAFSSEWKAVEAPARKSMKAAAAAAGRNFTPVRKIAVKRIWERIAGGFSRQRAKSSVRDYARFKAMKIKY